jgi:hypothetical protein
MAGDEITADWLGDTYSMHLTTDNITINRFNATSKRFKCFHIYNHDAVIGIYVGHYDSVMVTFKNRAVYIWPKTSIKLEFVDLYELACADDGAHVTLRALGINEY